MFEISEKIIAEITESIVREINPERIYVFGSYAKQETGKDSDLDLLIVEREPFGGLRKRETEINRIREVLSPFIVPVDILLYSTSEFEKWRNSVNHIIHHCLREGKLLYARS